MDAPHRLNPALTTSDTRVSKASASAALRPLPPATRPRLYRPRPPSREPQREPTPALPRGDVPVQQHLP